MNLKEIGIDTRNWVDSAQDRDYWRALMNATLTFGSISYRLSQLKIDTIFVAKGLKVLDGKSEDNQ